MVISLILGFMSGRLTPLSLIQGFMSGQGVAGIFASVVSIISLAVTHGKIPDRLIDRLITARTC